MIVRLVLLFILGIVQVTGLAAPMYTYLKGLCPHGLLPLTTSKHVKTCNDTCPTDARCIQGICCVRQPTCIDLTYMFPTSYSCLPNVKQNCPDGSRCVESSRKGMNICCSTTPTKRGSGVAKLDKGVCPDKMIVRLVLLFILGTVQVTALAAPMYTYLKGLCPHGLLPLTTSKHVKTCNDTCPTDARCIQGICCVRQPTCIDLTYMFPTSYSCLPNVKQNCPDGSRCVESSRKGMNICCSTKPAKRRSGVAKMDKGVCPASHPVIQHDNKTLTLCKHCNDGTCVSFRGSDVKVCCQSFESLCGAGSAVEMDGLLARDCTQNRCSEGFECSLTTSGSRVCCSYATCSSGSQARGVCAGGCRRNEQCEEIQGQRWCCPQTKPKQTKPLSKTKTGSKGLPDPATLRISHCPDNKMSNGACSPMNPFCSFGFSCQETTDGDSFLCCENPPMLLTFPPPVTLTTVTTTATTTTEPEQRTTTRMSRGKSFRTTTSASATCLSGELPMEMEGTPLMCPEEGAACPKAGYICQRSTQYTELFCCPIDIYEENGEGNRELETTTEPVDSREIETNEIEEELEEMTTRAPLIKISTRRKIRPRTKVTSTLPAFFILSTTASPSGPAPSCWIGHRPVRNVVNNEFKTCIGFLDFSCPLGSSCLPNATPGPMLTPQFLCCAKL